MKSNPFSKTERDSIGQQLLHGGGREDIVVMALQECQAAIDSARSIDRAAMLKKYLEIHEELAACLDGLELMRLSASGSNGESSAQIANTVQQHVAPSATLGDFRILREIGRGGMGVVYEAEQLSIGRNVALKVLPYAAMLDKRQAARFQNEARAAATLEHPHIVPVYFVGNERGVYYYAMRLIEGKNLAEIMNELRSSEQSPSPEPLSQIASQLKDGHLPQERKESAQKSSAPETLQDAAGVGATSIATDHGTSGKIYYESIARLGRQMADALDFAHSHGIVHRDRVANLRDGSGASAGANESYYLNAASTVTDDGKKDTLTGDGSPDWFFASVSDDLLSDQKAKELVENL